MKKRVAQKMNSPYKLIFTAITLILLACSQIPNPLDKIKEFGMPKRKPEYVLNVTCLTPWVAVMLPEGTYQVSGLSSLITVYIGPILVTIPEFTIQEGHMAMVKVMAVDLKCPLDETIIIVPKK